MNHFAHLVLAQPTTASAVGNLLGDFMRGVEAGDLSPAVQRGLQNHRAVDRFTDADAQIQALKSLFSPQRRRFAGVALDIWFDHLLLQHWDTLESGTLEPTISSFYRRLDEGQQLMPASMRRVTRLMIDNDWFGSYRDIESVAGALDRVADRIRFAHRFENVIDEILAHEDPIRDCFLDFYPRLRAHVDALAIETGTATSEP